MLVFHGIYSLRRKVVGFRNDYCLTCNSPRVALQHRTLEVFHLFFIPLLPLGFWKRWHCGTCKQNPHAYPRLRKHLKWLGTLLLALAAASTWSVPLSEIGDMTEDTLWVAALRIVLTFLCGLALWKTIRSPPDPDLAGYLEKIQPVTDPECPLCRTPLEARSPAWSCPKCGMERLALSS
jgi:hypothetical protein